MERYTGFVKQTCRGNGCKRDYEKDGNQYPYMIPKSEGKGICEKLKSSIIADTSWKYAGGKSRKGQGILPKSKRNGNGYQKNTKNHLTLTERHKLCCFYQEQGGIHMRTVKEVSMITGISVRTLHYYDEIGLLKPTDCSGAGYRLYDDKALEILQQILFFKEFDMPLKEIKSIMENPDLDRNQILMSQRKMLELKKDRLERLISSIDGILKGEKVMDFGIFSKDEMEEMYQHIVNNMSEELQQQIRQEYGGIEEYRKHFMEQAASKGVQENMAKVVEWYGDKESARTAAMNPENPEIFSAYRNRLEKVMEKLSAQKGKDVNSFQVKQIVGEYDFVSKQLYQMNDLTSMMLDMAKEYQTNTAMQKAQDAAYGEGTTEFIGQALEAFYKR